jgi:polyphosphate kinase
METFFNRDLSWLGFNKRVLMEAANAEVPVLERIKFLSIYSSNLDEFYRVRMPVLMAIDNLDGALNKASAYEEAKRQINAQQQEFGGILKGILPELATENIIWLYNKAFPSEILDKIARLFFNEILAFIHPVYIDLEDSAFFAENNKLYQALILLDPEGKERLQFINIPSDVLPRLYAIDSENGKYIVFLEDIIRHHINHLFPGYTLYGVFNIKITRDAELNLEDELDEDITAAIEKELAKRDFGTATRFLCEPGIPLRYLYRIIYALNLQKASIVEGGAYHNLKDLGNFPVSAPMLEYPKWPPLESVHLERHETLFQRILKEDLLVNVPYESYDSVLRFFNEAANDASVEEIYCTLYRVANTSKIVTALITAATNGKKVSAMLELKARFDEANNLKWASRMKAAGVKIIYSRSTLKVHAKVALVKRKQAGNLQYFGLLATGNFNETTAKFYTDHILFTSAEPILKELEALFAFLSKRKKKPGLEDKIDFEHLLVAQFNLHTRFLALIDREIVHAKAGKPAFITIKLNNLEERKLISKLYEASNAGVKIQLIVRSICCLVPGIAGQSENITVRRIVDRYLEHGRIFIFHNNGDEAFFMGSADWMNRNIYSRVEVCFPVYQPDLKQRIKEMVTLELGDTAQAVEIDQELNNRRLIPPDSPDGLRSQEAIYHLLQKEAR